MFAQQPLLHQIIRILDDLYPPHTAESWDVPGLQVGDPQASVTNILVTLDVTEAVIDEAIANNCNMIFAHHPLLFKPIAKLTPSTAPGKLALKAAAAGIHVFAAHTNLDVSAHSTSIKAFEDLGITEAWRAPLIPLPDERCYKVAVTIPNDEAILNRVRDAMHAAGGGADLLGPYAECAFAYPGIGSFTPLPEANPAIGKLGVREYVHEHRIEMMVRHSYKDDLLAAIYESHPYESPAIDLWDLNHGAIKATTGMGLIGTLPNPMTPKEILAVLQRSLHNPAVRLASFAPDVPIRRLAVCAGSASSLIPVVQKAVTPEVVVPATNSSSPTPVEDSTANPLGATPVEGSTANPLGATPVEGSTANPQGTTSAQSPNIIPSGPVDLYITADIGHHVALDALTDGLQLIDAGHYATENPAMDVAKEALEKHIAAKGWNVTCIRSTVNTDPFAATH